MTLLLVDTAVADYEKIVAAAQPHVTTVLFDRFVDTFQTLKDKISSATSAVAATTVGIVQHGDAAAPIYKLLETQAVPAVVSGVEQTDTALSTWTELIDFYEYLKTNGANTIDLISCALYANAGWVYVLQQLEQRLTINFRASSNNTGNVASGGDWIQESDGVNIETIYFTEAIREYHGLLAPIYVGYFSQLVVKPGAAIAGRVLNGGNVSFPMATKYNVPDTMKVPEVLKGDVIYNWGDFGGFAPAINGVVLSESNLGTIVTNYFASAVLKSDGSVKSWGSTVSGGSNSQAAVANSGSPVVALSCTGPLVANIHSFAALRSDGTVYGWGNGQSGFMAAASSGSPIKAVSMATNASSLTASAALRTDGTVYTWGSSGLGGYNAMVPAASSGSPVMNIVSGYIGFAALRADGSVYSWGAAGTENGAFANSGSPVIALTNNISTFAALRKDGTVYTWPSDSRGGLNAVVTAASSGSPVNTLCVNQNAYAALRNDGSVYAWGNTSFGGSSASSAIASSGSRVVGIAATLSGFAALRENGTVYSWGSAGGGGFRAAASSGSPVTAIAATSDAFSALREDGSVFTWGTVYNGVSGIPSNGNPIVSISAANVACCGLRADSTLVVWGSQASGGSNYFAQQAGSGIVSVVSNRLAFNALRSTNPTPSSASNAISSDLLGNYVVLNTGNTYDISIDTRAALNTLSGTALQSSINIYIKGMIQRVNGSKYTIPSSQIEYFKNTILNGKNNISAQRDIVQYFPSLDAFNANAWLDISDFPTDKYISIELPVNATVTLIEDDTQVATLTFNGTQVFKNGTLVQAGSNVTLGSKTLYYVAIGSLTGYPTNEFPPFNYNPRPLTNANSITYFWETNSLLVSSYTVTCNGPGGSVQTLGPSAEQYTFTGLTPGTTYSATLQVNFSAGSTLTSSFRDAIPGTRQGPPQITTADIVRNNVIALTWNEPTNTGNSTRQAYVLRDNTKTIKYSIEPWRTSYETAPLAAGTYTFFLYAVNSIGYSTGETVGTFIIS